MSKQKHVTKSETAGGESAVSLLEKYSGRTKALSGNFPPSWTPANPGEQVIGEFIEKRMVPKGKNVEKEFPAYTLKLIEWTKGTTFTRQEIVTAPSVGLVFGISGKVMDVAMESVQAGDTICLVYNGLAPKKGKRSPAKLIDVHALVAA